jgi:hypothetical protein
MIVGACVWQPAVAAAAAIIKMSVARTRAIDFRMRINSLR